MLKIVSRIARARPGGAQRGERRAVLDDAPLAAVVPDEVRDLVHVRVRAGGERREAHGRQRREDVESRAGTRRGRRARASAGAVRRSTASSNIAGVSPSMTTRMAFRSSRGQGCGARRAAPLSRAASATPSTGSARAIDVADDGTNASAASTSAAAPTSSGGAAAGAAARERAAHDRRRAERAEDAADGAGDRRGQSSSEPAAPRRAAATREGQRDPDVAQQPSAASTPSADAEPGAHADPVPAAQRPASVRGGVLPARCSGDTTRPTSRFADPATRGGDSRERRDTASARLLHERALRPRAPDGEPARAPRAQGAASACASRAWTSTRTRSSPSSSRSQSVPTLVLVKDKRAVARLDGRVSAPRIERDARAAPGRWSEPLTSRPERLPETDPARAAVGPRGPVLVRRGEGRRGCGRIPAGPADSCRGPLRHSSSPRSRSPTAATRVTSGPTGSAATRRRLRRCRRPGTARSGRGSTTTARRSTGRSRTPELEGTVHAGAHPLRAAGAERRDLGVPLHAPGDAPASPPATPTQACPAPPATISGTAVAADVGPSGRASRRSRSASSLGGSGRVTYANVHSSKWPAGEIRGQLNERED